MFFIFLEMVIVLLSLIGFKERIGTPEYSMNLGVCAFISLNISLVIVYVLVSSFSKKTNNKEIELKS